MWNGVKSVMMKVMTNDVLTNQWANSNDVKQWPVMTSNDNDDQ